MPVDHFSYFKTSYKSDESCWEICYSVGVFGKKNMNLKMSIQVLDEHLKYGPGLMVLERLGQSL